MKGKWQPRLWLPQLHNGMCSYSTVHLYRSVARAFKLHAPSYSVFQVGCPEDIKNGSWP